MELKDRICLPPCRQSKLGLYTIVVRTPGKSKPVDAREYAVDSFARADLKGTSRWQAHETGKLVARV